MKDIKCIDWYMKHYEVIDPIVEDIICKMKTKLNLPSHMMTTFYIDYDIVAEDLINHMYKTSYLR